ncbi:MAG: transcription antitermination factor NusB [Actinobacteria bacterium]|nr:transcription antitermination factor NusB [Actinomycetota bacterium]
MSGKPDGFMIDAFHQATVARDDPCPVIDQIVAKARIQVPFDELTMLLIEGVATQQTRIDELLASHSHAWTLDRMLATDRNVLRLGAFELIARSDVPTAVILNEAVRLAKRFGSDDSGRFVNGVLAAIARVVRAGETLSVDQSSAD